jgi:hypothetical protein
VPDIYTYGRNEDRVLAKKLEEKLYKWEDNIKMCLKRIMV